MSDEMGTSRVAAELENPLRPGERLVLSSVLVDTSARLSFVHVEGSDTSDNVIFGEPADPVRLGARSLAGLNHRVDPVSKRLIDAGPAPAAAAA